MASSSVSIADAAARHLPVHHSFSINSHVEQRDPPLSGLNKRKLDMPTGYGSGLIHIISKAEMPRPRIRRF